MGWTWCICWTLKSLPEKAGHQCSNQCVSVCQSNPGWIQHDVSNAKAGIAAWRMPRLTTLNCFWCSTQLKIKNTNKTNAVCIMPVLPGDICETVMTTQDVNAFEAGFLLSFWGFMCNTCAWQKQSRTNQHISWFATTTVIAQTSFACDSVVTALRQGMSFNTQGLCMIKLRRQDGP